MMADVPQVQAAHTADVDAATLKAARALLDEVFGPEMTDDDWDHSLGGVHAFIREGDRVVGHAAVVQRRIMNGGRPWRVGYVEGVAVAADRRRQGCGAALMEALERVITSAYAFGALGSTDEAVSLYASRGWQSWRGRLSVLTPAGLVPTPDEAGAVYVYDPRGLLDLVSELTCDWRDGDVW
jgi:aminoglycoside 2'-N-acetyltransferase I